MKTKLILSLLLILYLLLNLFCLFSESPIWDEPLQLTVGKMFWQTREFILEPVEPPFARLITSLPVVLLGEKIMTGTLGRVYFFPRLVVVLIGSVFLVFYFKVLKEIFNEKLAFLGLVFFIFEPNLLTHSHYNTTDFIFTVLFFLAIWFLRNIYSQWWRVGIKQGYAIFRQNQRKVPEVNFYLLAIILALLFATKVNGPVIFFFTIISFFLLSWRGSRLSRETKQSLVRLPRSLRSLAMTGLVFLISLWACYLFKAGPAISEKTEKIGKLYSFYIFENKPFWLKIFKTSLPLIDYLATLKYAVSYQKAGFDAYFAGNYSRYGWWWYFPAVFLLKTPLPLLTLFFTGTLFLFRANGLSGYRAKRIFYFLIPIIAVLLLSLFLRINQGLRHILPIYPFLIIISLFGWQKLWGRGKIPPVFLGGLLIWYIARTIYFLPHPITFTNELLPPNKSFKVLADSNLSWGQELIEISKYSNKQISKLKNNKISLFYFGNIRVEDYLSNFQQYGCDDYKSYIRLIEERKVPILVSATCLQKMAAQKNKDILKIKPKEIIANSVLVYW